MNKLQNYKRLFPIFDKNPNLHYLDSAATALKPKVVLDKMMEYYTDYSANIHRGLYPISERATEEYEKARKMVAEFLGAEYESEVIFTSGTTDSINLVARGWGEINLKEGDEIVVALSEHHSNMVPWQELAKRNKLVLRFVSLKQVTSDQKLEGINSKTKLLAVGQVSNVLGEINPIKEIVEAARKVSPDICVVVDGAQAVAHLPVDVKDMDVDFYTFSGHKVYGPTGVGVLYAKAKRQIEMNPVKYGGGMIKEVYTEGATWAEGPEKFEAGTPPIAEVIGLGAAIEFIKSIGWDEIKSHEKRLVEYLFKKLADLKWLKVVGSGLGTNRLGVVAMYAENGTPPSHDVAHILGRKFEVCVRAGHHCTMPLHLSLGLPYGTVRASLGIYNDESDIEALVMGLEEAYNIFEIVENG